MKKIVAAFFALLLVGAALYLPSCTPRKSDAVVEVQIGFAGPLTGAQADYGKSVSQGAQLRLDELNAQPRKYKLKLVMGDDQALPSQAVSVAQEFAANSRVAIVLGHFNSSCSNAAKAVYHSAKLPQISYGSTNDDVADGSDWTFRTPYKNSLQGRSLARFAKSKLHLSTVAILAENDAYGKDLAAEFKSEASKNGLKIVGEDSYDVQATDFRPVLIRIKSLEAESLLLAGFHPQIQAIARQARELGIKSTFLAGDGVGSSTEYIKNAGEAAEGTYATGPFLVEQDRPEIGNFRQDYEKRFKTAPDSWAVYAYDSVGMAAQVIDKVGPDRAKIREALMEFNSREKAFQGLVGPIYFDSNGDAVNKDMTIAVVEKGRYQIVDWSSP